ncbi:eukaryotic translation initiation factor 5B-like isoform X2 [Hibiscus syriacus]|uniref:eukaryotic translation initiation factor 5B-like isoform X2 n=1 Tax=Hibiscus syriacus TaxID=106335 RepID=UPI0019241B73|nr:eukaryotic translation initiation factor 5B-like isoform X2 [Hibiscus syriacus]
MTGGSAFDALVSDDDGEVVDRKGVNDENDDDILGKSLKGKKKKSKGGKKGGNRFAAGALDELDDEYSEKVDELKAEENVPSISFSDKKKKSSKKKKGNMFGGSDFDAIAAEDDDGQVVDDYDKEESKVEDDEYAFTGKKKSNGGKKGGGSRFTATALDEFENEGVKEDEEEDAPSFSLFDKKKKKSKSSKKSGNSFSAALLDEEDEGDASVPESTGAAVDDDEDDSSMVAFSGKKSSKKNNTALFAALGDELEDEEGVKEDEEEDSPSFGFSGKKKSSKKKNIVAFAALEGELENEEGVKEDEEEYVPSLSLSDKKKKKSKASKKIGNSFSAALLDEEDAPVHESTTASVDDNDDDSSMIAFSGKKKKSSKKKSSAAYAALGDEAELQSEVSNVVETVQLSLGTSNVEAGDSKTNNKSEDAAETSKNKKKNKKKNKSERTAQEEEDLDKILAELDEGPPTAKPTEAATPQEEKAQVLQEPNTAAYVTGEEEPVESAAAKKRKKKKEKEKEKKAAAAATADVKEEIQEERKMETSDTKKKDAKSKAADKKLPKHVREMQEALARRKEAEERKKKEEEDRLRKEEEERHRQEELERQAEEAKRRKKEKEKEKLLKKKQEGKLLTGKQKEEARRLEAMRNQILANAGGLSLPSADIEGAPTKRPIYKTKKSKPAHHANGAASAKPEENVQSNAKSVDEPQTKVEVESVDDKGDEVESNNAEERSVVADAEGNGMEEEDDDDGEWDEKSWDDVNLNIKGAFDDEEADSKSKPAVQKDIKRALPASHSTGPPTVAKPVVDSKKQSASESNTSHPEINAPEKNLKKSNAVQNKASKSDAPKQSEELRSPICCIMGHVDTGKTKLLDCIRGTNVQEGEAGGITQQIGATYFPASNIRERTKELKADATLKVPGLLIIDTPGHESFTNLRSRGSGLCDIAILVVDIMHGLEPQTIESLNLLKMRKTEFIVALNKVDRLYDWKVRRNSPIGMALKKQSKDVLSEFNRRVTHVITQFKEQGLNTELYYKNKEMGETFSIVPTSAVTGEGIPDLLLLLVQWTQKTMVEKLTFSDEVECTVLEVKVVEGLGTTIDVVLVNGVLHEGDQIVVCGLQGPIVTNIRALLTPQPMKEIRVKGVYMQHKEIKAAQGIKIAAQGLEHAIAGTSIYVVGPDDDVEDIKEAVKDDMQSVMSRIDKSGEGVYVQASTLGSLEALLEFLKTPEVNIPVSGIGIGPVHKKDIMKASVMLERKKEYATILAFDVKVTPEARELADELGVRIFLADIIYHLFDQFKAYIDGLKEERKREAADEAVFPCVLKILPNCIFNKKDPIVLGVDILEGILRIGTPICIPQREFIDIGRIASIENNHKPVDSAKKGQKVAIKIVGSNPEEQQKMYGRHFELEDELVSHISRRSIDILKANYRDDLTLDEWRLVQRLKILFKIP